MHITLNLTQEGKMVLFLESDRYIPNPTWAIDWVSSQNDKHNDSVYVHPDIGFSCIDGYARISGQDILSFLDRLINEAKNDQISKPKSVEQNSIAIESKEEAQSFHSKIRLLINNKITIEDFEQLKEPNTLQSSANLSSKKQFLETHIKYFSQNGKFFGLGCNKLNYNEDSDLSDIVKEAKENNGSARAVFRSLGWMNEEGLLTNNAPKDISAAYENTSMQQIEKPAAPV